MEQSDAKEYRMIAEWRLVEEAMIGEWMMTGEVIKVRLEWKADLDQIMPAQSFVTWKREAVLGTACDKMTHEKIEQKRVRKVKGRNM